MIIRQEQKTDYDETYDVVQKAFENAEYSDGNEQNLLVKLRESQSFLAQLSLVAEIEGKIVGHILFTQATVADEAVLALAPLSVLPDFQGQGIGKALVQAGHNIAKMLGYSYSIVLGNPHFYSKLGYFPAEKIGVIPPFEVPSENFMAYKLNENVPEVRGVMNYAPEF